MKHRAIPFLFSLFFIIVLFASFITFSFSHKMPDKITITYYYTINIISFNNTTIIINYFPTLQCHGLIGISYYPSTGLYHLDYATSSCTPYAKNYAASLINSAVSAALHQKTSVRKTDLFILINYEAYEMGACKTVYAGGAKVSLPLVKSLTIYFEKNSKNIPLFLLIHFNYNNLAGVLKAWAIEWSNGNPCDSPFPSKTSVILLTFIFILILVFAYISIKRGREWVVSALRSLSPPLSLEEEGDTYPLGYAELEDYP